MKFRILLTLIILTLAIFAQSDLQPVRMMSAVEAQTRQRNESVLVANVPIQATLQARQKSIPTKGNLSLRFEVSPEQLRTGTLLVRDFNLAFFGVDQAALSGRDTKQKTGVLGMTLPPPTRGVQLKYDAQTQTASGEIPVQAHFPQLDEFFPPELVKNDRESDFAVSRTQRGTVKIQIKFTDALDKAATAATTATSPSKLNAQVSAEVVIEALSDNRYRIESYQLRITEMRLVTELAILRLFESARSLCLQPVRIRSGAADPTPTGAGLAFGIPGANTQWNKADIVFQVRDFMTVTNAAWKVATEGAEETDIRASVNVDDCIEIFFVENFNPESLHGGGATWSSGTANAKIITSDGNAVGGIDRTHLAHELGHVLFMGHPGDPFGMFDPSTNTLMCPSGWRRDNPARNSVDNTEHVANPLLTFTLKRRTPGPDCNASGDCGACP